MTFLLFKNLIECLPRMEYSFKWIVGILLIQIPLIDCFYEKYIVEDSCKLGNETIIYNASNLGSVGKLIASSKPPYQINKDCKIIINPPLGYGIVASIQKIDFRQPSYYCLDYLKIFHSDVLFSPTTLCRFKFDFKENLSYYSKGRMEMLYHVESKLSDGLNIEEGFSLTFTVVSEDMQDCMKTSMFMCNNGRCLPNSLTCDMKNNCGDNSDESNFTCDSPRPSFLQISDVMYGVVICIFIFVMVFSCGVIVTRKRRRDSDSTASSDSEEPTATLTPYQSVHPQGFFICQNPAGPRTPYFQHSKIVQSEGGFTNPCYPMGVPQPPPPYNQ